MGPLGPPWGPMGPRGVPMGPREALSHCPPQQGDSNLGWVGGHHWGLSWRDRPPAPKTRISGEVFAEGSAPWSKPSLDLGPKGPQGAPWAPMGAQGALFTGDFPIALRGLLGGAREGSLHWFPLRRGRPEGPRIQSNNLSHLPGCHGSRAPSVQGSCFPICSHTTAGHVGQ